jgi:hypothetical protein
LSSTSKKDALKQNRIRDEMDTAADSPASSGGSGDELAGGVGSPGTLVSDSCWHLQLSWSVLVIAKRIPIGIVSGTMSRERTLFENATKSN